ncbi:MAG: cytidylate kinase-like family protein [Dehalococcoidia bacterium]
MSVITIEGRVGAGAPEIGRIVAQEMDLDFVDRLMLADIAKRVGATVGALADSERRVPTLGGRLAQAVQRMLHRSAVAGMGGDPYFGPGIEHLLARPYREMEEPPATSGDEVDEQRFVATTAEVIRDLAADGNKVILSRGGAAILRDLPSVLRVGVVARMEDRIKRVMSRDRVTEKEAEEIIKHSDAAQHRYFERAFNSSPIDPFLYHFMWNTSDVSIEYAAQVTVDAARMMSDKGLRWAPAVSRTGAGASAQ